jgi:LPS-assembly lipoprotein
MWWCKSISGEHRPGPGVVCLLLGAAVALSACGFKPLYGRSGAQALSPVDHMAAIRIAPLEDRIGQQMHNLLRDRLNPYGQPRDPVYRLDVAISETRQELGIRKDETATRANLVLSASFLLRELESDRVLLRGRTSSVNSFNILANQFATDFSEADARERALREISDNIRVRLGIYFSADRKSAS